MNDEELDAAIAERFRAYEAGVRLPCGFKCRFVGSVRRKRTMKRMGMLGMIGALAAVCVAIAGLARKDSGCDDAQPALTARAVPTNENTRVSCLMLLGYLHECLVRPRPARRKEEE